MFDWRFYRLCLVREMLISSVRRPYSLCVKFMISLVTQNQSVSFHKNLQFPFWFCLKNPLFFVFCFRCASFSSSKSRNSPNKAYCTKSFCSRCAKFASFHSNWFWSLSWSSRLSWCVWSSKWRMRRTSRRNGNFILQQILYVFLLVLNISFFRNTMVCLNLLLYGVTASDSNFCASWIK